MVSPRLLAEQQADMERRAEEARVRNLAIAAKANEGDTAYQSKNQFDSLLAAQKAIEKVTQQPEYTKRSGASWNPNVATTQQIQEENPGLLSRIGTTYTNWTRPYVAPVYYAMLKANAAITGDTTNVNEMRRFYELRKQKAKGDLSRTIGGWFHPLDKEESEVLSNIWERNPLPYGFLGAAEIVVDPINILPVGYMAKVTAKTLKTGTRLLLGKGNRFGMPEEPVIPDSVAAKGGFTDEDYLRPNDNARHFDDQPQTQEAPGNPDNPSLGTFAAVKAFLARRFIRKDPPSIDDNNITNALPPTTVINPTDELLQLETALGKTVHSASQQINGPFRVALEKSAPAFQLDALGGVINVTLDRAKAQMVIKGLKQQQKVKGISTKDLDELKFLEKEVTDLLDEASLPYYTHVIEHADLFNFNAAQNDYLQAWFAMQDDIFEMGKRVPEFQLKKHTYSVVDDATQEVYTGNYYPKIARQKFDRETGEVTELRHNPWIRRELTGLVEEGVIRANNDYIYETDMIAAATEWYQAAALGTANAIFFKKVGEMVARNSPENLDAAFKRLLAQGDPDQMGKDWVNKILLTGKVTPTDGLMQSVTRIDSQVAALEDVRKFVHMMQGLIELDNAGLLAEAGIRSLRDLSKANLLKVGAKLKQYNDTTLDPEIKKLEDFEKAIGEPRPVRSSSPPMDPLPGPRIADKLPQELSRAKPRFNQMSLEWESDIDMAMYIIANPTKLSRSHGKYVAWLRKVYPNISEQDLMLQARRVRNDISSLAKSNYTEGGLLRIPITNSMRTVTRAAADIPKKPAPRKLALDKKLHLKKAFLKQLQDESIDESLIPKAVQRELLELSSRPREFRQRMDQIRKGLLGGDKKSLGRLPSLRAQKKAIDELRALSTSKDPTKALEDTLELLKSKKGNVPLRNIARKLLRDEDPARNLTHEGLEDFTAHMDTELENLNALRADNMRALEARVDDIDAINPVKMQLEDGSILKIDTKLVSTIASAPETKELPFVLRTMTDINMFFRMAGTTLDASQPIIQGLRLLPVAPKVWAQMYTGGIKDIIAGNIDTYEWYSAFMSSIPPLEMARYTRMGIPLNEVPEYLEILNRKSFKSKSEWVEKQLDKVPGDMTQKGSGQWLVQQFKNRPLAAIRVYTAQSNMARIAMAQALTPQVRNAAMQKLGFQSYDAMRLLSGDELVAVVKNQIPPQWLADPATGSLRAATRDDAARLIREALEREDLELGEIVNKATGLVNSMAGGGLSKFVQDHQVMSSLLLFAPRFFASQLSLTADILRFGTRGRLARESTAQLLSAGFMFYSGTSLMLGQEPKLDPRPKKDGGDGGDFLSLQINGVKVSIGGSATALLKLLIQQYGSLRRGTFEVTPGLPDPENNSYFRFLTNRLSPIGGVTMEIAKGRTYSGHPVDWGDTPFSATKQSLELLGPNLAPFWAQSLVDAPMNQGWGSRLAGMGAEFIGFNSYATSPWDVVHELRNQYADSDYGDAFEEMYGRRPEWDDLDESQQTRIEINHEDVRAAERYGREVWGDRAFTSMQADINSYMQEADIITTDFNREYRELEKNIFERFESGTDYRPGKYFRDRRADMFRDKTRAREELNETYAEVIEYFNEPKDPDKFIPIFNLIKQQYMDNIVYAEDLESPNLPGGFDYEERDRRVQEFTEIFGEDMLATIRQHVEMVNASEHYLEREYRWGRDIARKYWKVPEFIIEQEGLTHIRALWLRYDAKSRGNDVDREEARAMLIVSPELKRIESMTTKVRIELRKEDPIMERYLYKYGYVSTFENKENNQIMREAVDLTGSIGMAKINIPYPPWKLEAIRAAELDNQQQM